jgi:hypothetical protein
VFSSVLGIELDVGRLDRELPPRRHGIARVHGEIHDHLLELSHVGPHGAEVGGEGRRKIHVLAEDPWQHLPETGDHDVHVHDARLEHLLTAEREELPGEGRGALRGLPYLLDIVSLRIVPAEVFEQQVAIARNHSQQVVEVVRDPSGQPADCFHFLRLHELLLQAALFGDISDEGLVALELPSGIPHRADAELHVQEAAVLPLPGRFHVVVFAIGVGIPLQQPLPLGGVGVHIPRHIESEQLRGRLVTQDADQGPIHRQEPALRGRAVDADGGVFH